MREHLLPAVRANTSLRTLRVDTGHEDDEAEAVLDMQRIVAAR